MSTFPLTEPLIIDPDTLQLLNAALLLAAKKGHPIALQTALAHGANPLAADDQQMTALHWAAKSGSAPCVAFLLPYFQSHTPSPLGGVPLSCPAPQRPQTNPSLLPAVDVNTPDGLGRSALLWAAYHGHTDCLSLLLPLSDPTQTDLYGRSAFHWASSYGHVECLTLLLPTAHPCQTDNNGLTALHSAAQKGHSDCVAFLLPFSDLSLRTHTFHTPLQLAYRSS